MQTKETWRDGIRRIRAQHGDAAAQACQHWRDLSGQPVTPETLARLLFNLWCDGNCDPWKAAFRAYSYRRFLDTRFPGNVTAVELIGQ